MTNEISERVAAIRASNMETAWLTDDTRPKTVEWLQEYISELADSREQERDNVHFLLAEVERLQTALAAVSSERDAALARVHTLEEAGAEVEMRLQEHSELFANILDRAMKSGWDEDAKRKTSEAWKWAYYGSAIHLQVIVGSEAREAYRAKVAKSRADGDAWFAEQAARQHDDAAEGSGER